MAVELDRPGPPGFTRTARRQLRDYPWPGNIRELKNVVERAVYRNTDGPVDDIEMDPFAAFEPGSGTVRLTSSDAESTPSRTASPMVVDVPETLSLDEAVGAVEIQMLRRALQQTRYNQKKAAAALGLTYDRLRRLMSKHTGSLDAE
jgi:psp operon transcriptional activator